MPFKAIFISLAVTALPSAAAWASEYYVAPQGATLTCAATGTVECPFASIDAALTGGATGGDTILLMDGYHGSLTIEGRAFDSPLTIRSQNARNARLQNADFGPGTQNVTLRDLQIWPDDPHAFHDVLLFTGEGTRGITLDHLDVRAGADAGDYLTWGRGEWLGRAMDGAYLAGIGHVIRNSSFLGIRFGIQLDGPDSQAIGNLVDGYSGDGLRANGSGDRVMYNQVTNCISVDENHADGFQSFTTPDRPIQNLLIEGNVIVEWARVAESPYRCDLQGIGMFDGFYDHLTIRNNVVVNSHYHGIAVYGARGALIENNTVVNNRGLAGIAPWITVNPHKNGTPSTQVIVANNLAMSFGDPSGSISYVNNKVVTAPLRLFRDFWSFDMTPGEGSGLVDAGESAFAPPLDILGNRRPAGRGPDLGAIELGATGATGIDLLPTTGIVTWGRFNGGK